MLKRLGAALALLLVCALPARAAVTMDFYSHKLSLIARGMVTYFPHGFVLLSGTTEDGKPVRANLGFTAKSIFINVLWEPITGELDPNPLPEGYIDEAVHHFSLQLTDAQYRAVLAVADKWRNWPQPSYDIDEHNCVLFVKELAVAVGLSVSDDKKFIHAPGDFLDDVGARNAASLAARGAVVYRAGAAAGGASASVLEQRVKELERDARRRAN